MAFTIGKYGVGTLVSLGKLMAAFYVTCLIFIFVVLGGIAWLAGFSIWKFIKYIKEELLIVLGTSSSESVLPRMIAKLENLGLQGVGRRAGHPDRLFVQSRRHLHLSDHGSDLPGAGDEHRAHALAAARHHRVLLLTSKGAAGVTGSGFIVLAATLASVGTIPVASIALILGVDRFMSEARALTNLIGNGVATIVVSKWEDALDEARMRQHLDHETDLEADAPEQAMPA